MQQDEYLFELAPLGPEDLLSRCGEGPGNWWGDVDEDCLRVDERGRVVLVDTDVYYEVSNTDRRNRDTVVYSNTAMRVRSFSVRHYGFLLVLSFNQSSMFHAAATRRDCCCCVGKIDIPVDLRTAAAGTDNRRHTAATAAAV